MRDSHLALPRSAKIAARSGQGGQEVSGAPVLGRGLSGEYSDPKPFLTSFCAIAAWIAASLGVSYVPTSSQHCFAGLYTRASLRG